MGALPVGRSVHELPQPPGAALSGSNRRSGRIFPLTPESIPARCIIRVTLLFMATRMKSDLSVTCWTHSGPQFSMSPMENRKYWCK
jgi:hypothetical protein